MVRLILLSLFAVLPVFASDPNAFIKDFSSRMKQDSRVNSPDKIKSNIEKSVRYNDNALRQNNVDALTDEQAKSNIINMMNKTTSRGGGKTTYTCKEERIVNIVSAFKCSLSGQVFDSSSVCEGNCFKQHECVQANCYTAKWCDRLQGGYVCPFDKVQCWTSCRAGWRDGNRCVSYPDVSREICARGQGAETDICLIQGVYTALKGHGYYYSTVMLSGSGRGGFVWCEAGKCDWNKDPIFYTFIEAGSGSIRICEGTYYENGREVNRYSCSGWLSLSSTGSVSYTVFSQKDSRGRDFRGKGTLTISVRDGRYIKLCYLGACSDEVEFCNAANGFTFNSSSGYCESQTAFVYSCPVSGSCVQDTPGVAFCSPYTCNTASFGVWCSNGNVSGVDSANKIDRWQCEYDRSWYMTENDCKSLCNAYRCRYNGNWYYGQKPNCDNNCREKGQCQQLQQ